MLGPSGRRAHLPSHKLFSGQILTPRGAAVAHPCPVHISWPVSLSGPSRISLPMKDRPAGPVLVMGSSRELQTAPPAPTAESEEAGPRPESILGIMSDRVTWILGRQMYPTVQRPCIIRLQNDESIAVTSERSRRNRLRGKSMYSFLFVCFVPMAQVSTHTFYQLHCGRGLVSDVSGRESRKSHRPCRGQAQAGWVGGGVPCSVPLMGLAHPLGMPLLHGRGWCSRSHAHTPPSGCCRSEGASTRVTRTQKINSVEPGSDFQQVGAGSQGSPGS